MGSTHYQVRNTLKTSSEFVLNSLDVYWASGLVRLEGWLKFPPSQEGGRPWVLTRWYIRVS